MKAAIITVGTEILIGSILNTNSKYLSEKLLSLGVNVDYQLSIKDDFNEISAQANELLKKVDILLLCGGLGPTEDDLTKEALANAIKRKVILDENQYSKMLERFSKLNRTMTENNKKQAMVIEGSKILDNKWGIAPGEVIEYETKKIFLFPGPPKEFEPMVDFYLAENIKNESNIVTRSLNIIGLGESATEDKLRNLNLENNHISINTFAHNSDTEIKIIGEGKGIEIVKEIELIADKLYKTFGNNLYSENNKAPKETLVEKLIEKNLKISFAESITGGLLASNITSVSGASKILKNSIVAYSNEAKNKILGVNQKTLNEFGAVSSEVAFEMARGLYDLEFCDIAISTTGEAGPEPSEKEVGKVFVCYYYKEHYEIKEYFFRGNRNEIQNRVSNEVITHLLLTI